MELCLIVISAPHDKPLCLFSSLLLFVENQPLSPETPVLTSVQMPACRQCFDRPPFLSSLFHFFFFFFFYFCTSTKLFRNPSGWWAKECRGNWKAIDCVSNRRRLREGSGESVKDELNSSFLQHFTHNAEGLGQQRRAESREFQPPRFQLQPVKKARRANW